MVFGRIVNSPRNILSPVQALELANIYLSNARSTNDTSIAMVLCHDTEVSLSQAKRAAKHTEAHTIHDGIATTYIELGKLLEGRGNRDEAQASYEKAQKLGGRLRKQQGRLVPYPVSNSGASSAKGMLNPKLNVSGVKLPFLLSLGQHQQSDSITTIPEHIFVTNIHPPAIVSKLPEPDERLIDTTQLACCLGLLKAAKSPDDILEPNAREWIQSIESDPFEQERLKIMATDVIRVFKRDELKDVKAVAEVVRLAPALEKEDFQYLLKELYSGISQSDLLDIHKLEGLAQLIQGADPGHLEADDLVKILGLLSTRLRDTHHQSSLHMYQLTMAVSHVLDAMADANVKYLDREKLHEPLSFYLEELKGSSDPYLVYQAAYAYQALLYVPDDETLWQAAFRRTGKVIRGVSGLVSSVKGLDLNGFIEGLNDIQQGLAGASEVIKQTATTIDRMISATSNGQEFLDCLKEGLSFGRKRDWYPALRLADTLLRDGQFATFKELICEAPCRRDPAFLWGVCQRLSEVATDSTWDPETHRGAVEFLGAIYRNDATWGLQASVKQWIVIILVRLASSSDSIVNSVAEALIQELMSNTDPREQLQGRDVDTYPLAVASTSFASPSLLDRAQNKPDVEGHLRQLMKQRLKEETKTVYIPPQAKVGLHASDNARFQLMDKVKEFITNDQKVFLLLGDSGAGKSTFIRALECDLWQAYKKGGLIPLHINLPAIDKPDQDMIAKHFRKSEFTESQIRELKEHRKFILICDGYDESQQTHNLYTTNRLNQPGEWQAKMLISCRSEYIGADYRDRFQPGGRNLTSETTLFQEAVITPFSVDQVEAYINKYVSIRQPLWEAREYKKALDHVPSLKKLVRNPFLMSLSLEVLPRMMDPGEGHSATRITKVALYDQFVEHWLERGKKRLGEKELSPQARAAFESLSDEGFTKNGIDFLKKLAVAIYKEQDGQPIVEYSRYKDETSWKAEFFNREDRQLLREACPLTRTGNQHRFIHRSLLEYGLARAIFDPQEWKETVISQPALGRRGSTGSAWSFEDHDSDERPSSDVDQEPDVNSPLVWRNFVNDPSLLQFMEERVQQEPVFRQQLLKYIEYSKGDKKWRRAAANAITILIRAGVEFRLADLEGIQIPGADLRYGVFDSANLQGADLRKSNLRNIWLRGADLSRSHMAGVQFGELPILKHDCEMRACLYSPDGSSFAMGLDDGTIIVYATSTWEILWTICDHSKRITGLAYSPNGDRLVSGSHDSTVRLWDVSTGQCRQIFTGHSDQVFSVAYSPRGDLVASSSHDGAVRLWDVETGACRHILTGYDRYINHVVFSPKGDSIATSSWDFTVRLWDVATGKCRSILSGHTEWITSIAYSPQGDLIVSGGRDRVVRVWVVETGKCRHVLHGYGLADIIFSPKGNQIAFCESGSVSLWDVETGACVRKLSRPKTTVYRIAYSPQGDQIVSSCSGEAVRLWDVETGECRHTMTGHTSFVMKVQYSPKGDCIASVSWDGTVRLWDVGSGTSRKISNDHNDSVLNIKHSPKRSQIASCSEDSTIRLWDAKTGVCCRTMTGHSGFVYKISYSPQEDQLVSCSEDKTVRVWDVESGACQHIFTGHTGNVSDVKFSPQGNRIASASQDMTVRLWDVETGGCHRILTGHTGVVLVVTYSPQGHQVASGSWDMTMRLWDAKTGACQHVLTGHTKDVKRITYSPDGSQIASASEDTTIRLWDVKAGVCSHIFIGHQKTVTRVVYSPQGDQVASASVDNTVRIWDVESGECRHTLIGHKKQIAAIAFSPRANLIVSWADFGEARLWDVKTGECRWTLEYDTVSIKSVYSFLQHNAVWISSDTDAFITGGRDGSVRVWDVVEEGDQCQVRMRWRSTNGRLTARDACIQDVEGLSHLNQRLLKQRGAVGESVIHLREAGNKLNTMGSVVPQFKSSLTKAGQGFSSAASPSARQTGQQMDRAKDA